LGGEPTARRRGGQTMDRRRKARTRNIPTGSCGRFPPRAAARPVVVAPAPFHRSMCARPRHHPGPPLRLRGSAR
jgi:hypothetical protein